MADEILAVCIPSKKDKSDSSEICIDFLFQSEDYKTIEINSILQFECFLDDIDDISCNKKQGKIYYHSDHIKDYLKNNHKSLAQKLKLERFNSNNEFILFKLLAKNGIITLINSEYMSMLFIPEKLKESQKKSLNMLKYIIDSEHNFFCIVEGDDFYLENVKYIEILNFLDISNYEKRK